MILGLIITLIVFALIYGLVDDMIKTYIKKHTPEPPAPPEKFPARFFGGPIDGHENEMDERRLHYFIPTAPDEDESMYVQMGGMPMVEAVYAKYESVGDEGDYFFVEKVSREEMVNEIMKEDGRDGNG